jgi:hypothetical protein
MTRRVDNRVDNRVAAEGAGRERIGQDRAIRVA